MKINWRQRLWQSLTAATKRRGNRRPSVRPVLEALEIRTLPSTVAPFVQSIDRTTPAGALTNAASVVYTVTFNEPVTGVNPTDFQLAAIGTVGTTLTQVTPVSASVYKVAVSGITGNGTLGLNLVDNGSIRDLAGDGLVQPNAPASFFSQTTFATGQEPYSVAVADVNGDGKPDLVTANYSSGSVSVLLGNGNGTFQSQMTFAAGPKPDSVAVADVNHDNKADVVVTNLFSSSASVLLGNGDGTFQALQTFATGSEPISVAVADVNGGNNADLVVANAGSSSVSVLLGNGNGTFQSQSAFGTGALPFSVAAAQLTGDGNLDLVVANYDSGSVSVLLGQGNGTFQTQAIYPAGPQPFAVAVADVNGDGKPDIVVANHDNPGTVSVLLGNGDGTFQAPISFATGSAPTAVAVADVTGDGNPDLIVANGGDNTVSVLLGNGNGTFQAQQTFAVGFDPRSLAVADVNGDGRPDLVVANQFDNDVGVLLNAGNGNFTGQAYTIDTIAPFVQSIVRTMPAGPVTSATSVTYTVTFSEPVTGVVPSDFQAPLTGTATGTVTQVSPSSGAVYTVTVSGITGDGTVGLNLVDNGTIRDLAGNSLTQQNAPAAFQAPQTFAADNVNNPGALVLGDLTGDGKLDIVSVNGTEPNGAVSVLLGNGNGTFQAQQTFATGSGPSSVALGDLTGDGIPDIVVANEASGTISVLLGNGNGTFQAQQTFSTGVGALSVQVADVNGDGKPDLVVVGDSGNAGNGVGVLLGNGNGTFQAPQNFAAGPSPITVAVADLTGDGIADLVVGNGNTPGIASVYVLLGNGNGTFQAQQTFASSGFHEVVLGDVNGDGKTDIVSTDFPGPAVRLLLGNGNGTFQAQQMVTVTSGLFSAALGDLTGNGKTDLIVGYGYNSFYYPAVGVLLGNGNGSFQAQQTFAADSNPSGFTPNVVAVGDLNGDGRPDIVAGGQVIGQVSVLLNADNGNFTGPVYDIVGPATHFVISGTPTSVSAGSSVTFTVTAEDASNNIASGYAGTVAFSSSDTAATLPGNSTLSAGVGVFSATLVTAGSQTLTATDTVTSSLTGASSPILVTTNSATHFVFSGTPSSVSAGTGFSFTVTAEDQFNNTATGYSGTVVLSSTDSFATFVPASSTLTAGVGTFSATLITAGNQTLTATDSVSCHPHRVQQGHHRPCHGRHAPGP